jgi:hypothetical protein
VLAAVLSFPACSQVLTQHNNNSRTGWNDQEMVLNKRNVKTDSFGIIFSRPVDDQIYAQPLVANVNMGSAGQKNVVFIATVNNTVYAFDADAPNAVTPYWQVSLNPIGWRAIKNTETACGANNYHDFSGNFGIVGTPVIDLPSNTLYVVAKSVSGSPATSFRQELHALDLSTGAEKAGSPVTIAAQVTGNGSGNSGGIIRFDPQLENQRSGLLLDHGVVYITWASHGDCGNYHGWIIGYDKTTLAQKYVYNTTPDGSQGGIWMSGCGLSADENGNIYAAVGNGSVGKNGVPADITNRSESALKLTPSGNTLTVASFFTPSNYQILEEGDKDFGVTGMILLPNQNQAISGAKDGSLYLMNRDALGGYNSTSNQVVQSYNENNTNAHNLSSLTYYQGTSKNFVYIWSDNAPLRAFPYNTNTHTLDLANIVSQNTNGPAGYNGAFISGSSNAMVDSTAILWVSHAANGCNANQQTCPGIVRAFDALDVSKELWNSSLLFRDNPGNYAKFNCPTVVNGKVYLATFSNRLVVYGITKKYVTAITDQDEKVEIYPNPAQSQVHVRSGSQLAKVSILGISGSTCLQISNLSGQEYDLEISALPNGLYIIEVQTSQGVYREKMVIRH